MLNNLVVCVFVSDCVQIGLLDEFLYVVIIYCLIEYFYFWIKYGKFNVIIQFEQFVEIGVVLVDELGINNGSCVCVSFKCGYIEVVVMVIKWIKVLQIDGKIVYQVGVLIYWGFFGVVKFGYIVNMLINVIGDGNLQMFELKCILVKVEKVQEICYVIVIVGYYLLFGYYYVFVGGVWCVYWLGC